MEYVTNKIKQDIRRLIKNGANKKEYIKLIRQNKNYSPAKIIYKNGRDFSFKTQNYSKTELLIVEHYDYCSVQIHVDKFYQLIRYHKSPTYKMKNRYPMCLKI